MPAVTASAQEIQQEAETAQQENISTDVLERAIALAEAADTEGVIPIVAAEYEERLANAKNVLARVQAGDEGVTQDMVDACWQSLMDILRFLEFKQGDKSELEEAIEFAEGLILSDYEDNENKTAFLEALEAAKKVRDDENAMQDEITDAWKALIKAASELNYKMANMDDLKSVIAWMETLDLDKYLDEGKAEFNEALEAARATAENILSPQSEVDNAWKALMDAGSALRLKPDKGALDELLRAVENYLTEEASYEQAAFAAFQAVYAEAEAVYMNDQATEDEVADAVERLTGAAETDQGTAGDEGTVSGKDETAAAGNAASENTDDAKVIAKAESGQTAEKSGGITITSKVPTAGGGAAVTAKAVKTGDTADIMYLAVLLGASACIAAAAAAKKASGRR